MQHSLDMKTSRQRLADGGLYGLPDKVHVLLTFCILLHFHSRTGAAALYDARLVA